MAGDATVDSEISDSDVSVMSKESDPDYLGTSRTATVEMMKIIKGIPLVVMLLMGIQKKMSSLQCLERKSEGVRLKFNKIP